MSEWLTTGRQRALLWLVGSAVLFAVLAIALWLVFPWQQAPASATERVINATIQLRWPVLLLFAMVIRQFRIFDGEAAGDPLAGAESRRFKVNRQVLQNSFEQFVLYMPTILAFAAIAATDDLWRLVPISILLFTAGRLIFWIGYSRSPELRAPGFAISFGANICTLLLVFYLAF